MAAWCRFFHLPPSDYWALTHDEHAAMVRLMNRVAEQRAKQK